MCGLAHFREASSPLGPIGGAIALVLAVWYECAVEPICDTVSDMDEVSTTNRRFWDGMSMAKCDLTQPWLGLSRQLLDRYVRGDTEGAPDVLFDLYPLDVLVGVAGRDILCLASGGGQQSAVFGLLGAKVTVVDISDRQLQADDAAAAHYGYKVTCVQGDMRDLSCLGAESFDLVYQPPSMAYVPDVRQVYRQVVRVLRPVGTYRVEFTNPAIEFVDPSDWDGHGYAISRPYAVKMRTRIDGAVEFRHYLRDIFGGLVDAGFSIRQVYDGNPQDKRPDLAAEAGRWRHSLAYLVGFVIVAERTEPHGSCGAHG